MHMISGTIGLPYLRIYTLRLYTSRTFIPSFLHLVCNSDEATQIQKGVKSNKIYISHHYSLN